MAWEYSRWSIALWLGLLFSIGGQAFPYGRSHTNPPTVSEPAWDSPQTRRLAEAACFDCHSNETRWPMLSHVAPASWLVQHDVEAARAALNFSEWPPSLPDVGEPWEAVIAGEMPPLSYRVMHREARLSPAARLTLARGLAQSAGTEARR